jgi:hypothetical protein
MAPIGPGFTVGAIFLGEAKTNAQSVTISRLTSRPFMDCRLKFPGSRSVLFNPAMRGAPVAAVGNAEYPLNL